MDSKLIITHFVLAKKKDLSPFLVQLCLSVKWESIMFTTL